MKAQWYQFVPKSLPPEGRIKCGMLGAGQFYRYAYAPALNQKTSPLVISGIWARDPNRFSAAQDHLRYQTDFFSHKETLLAAGLDAVLIALPNRFHFSAAKDALEKKLHVFCEKPLTLSIADALELRELARQHQRVVMVDFNQRFLDRNRVLHASLRQGRFGSVRSVHAFHNQDLRELPSFAALHCELTGGGVVLNAGIHFINLFLHWFGQPESVFAVFENRALPRECGEDTAHCEFKFPQGVTATLDASLANAVSTSYERVHVVSSAGEVMSDLKRGDILFRPTGKPQLKIPCTPEIISDSVGSALNHFAACVRNQSSPETGIDDFIATLKIVEALTLSAQRGATVELAEIEKKYV